MKMFVSHYNICLYYFLMKKKIKQEILKEKLNRKSSSYFTVQLMDICCL